MINITSLKKNFGANGLTVVLNTFFQFISVPIFLSAWGVEMYADWLVLLSLTSYFAMTDVGLNTVTTNEFCISYAKNDNDKCNSLFNNNLFFILAVFSFVLIFSIGTLFFINLSSAFKLATIPEISAEIIVISLIIQVFIGMISGLFDTIYRATDRNATSIMINNYVRIAENIVIILGVLAHLELTVLIIIYIVPKFSGFAFKLIKVPNYFSLRIHPRYFNKNEFKRIIVPSLSFLSFPVGNSIVLQGFTLLVNFTLGSVALVVYNTTRTFINFIKVGLGLINSSVWPEFSLAYGRGDILIMKKLHRYSVSLSFYFALLASAFLFIFGEWIFTIWTKGEVVFDLILFISFIFTLLSNTIWFTSSVVLSATNNHRFFSLYYVSACILSLFLGFLIIKFTNTISFLPLSLFVIDVFLIYIVLKNSLIIVNDSFKNFTSEVLLLPLHIINKTCK